MGILSTAVKMGIAGDDIAIKIGAIMATLNKKPSEIMKRFRVHSCTDVTGFGLMGHLHEMLKASGVGARLAYSSIPILPEALTLVSPQTIPGGSKSNFNYLRPHVQVDPHISDIESILIFDAQTSGGLIMSVHADDAQALLADLHKEGITEARLIGEVYPAEAGRIIVER
jgi:selenide,water dikinase